MPQDYNFREYASRRIALGFRENMAASSEAVPDLMAQANVELESVRRQALINAMYHGKESVMTAYTAQRRDAGVPPGAAEPAT